ncbi:MAG: septal ring lytic transglycosylase RlpA family protein [Desulfobacteraceae bacterium]|nr:MAG: septal ring lytic transglycosylase RlpA family protein [Desulfobacteraceae bacterium]
MKKFTLLSNLLNSQLYFLVLSNKDLSAIALAQARRAGTLYLKKKSVNDIVGFIFFLLIIVSIFGCAVGKKQIRVSSYKKPAIVLPKRVDGRLPKSYSVNGVAYYPLLSGEGFVQEGMASWYGKKFHGKKTSTGEIYNMYKKTAAHKTLPFGTYVKVENLSNLREVVVRINDRGPFVKDRIIDLSYGAGRQIGLVGPGVARVRLVALSRKIGRIKSGNDYMPLVEAKDFRKGEFTIQVGAFENKDNARRLVERLRVIFSHVTITTYVSPKGETLYRVRVSLSKDLTRANEMVDKLKYLGFSETFIVAL